MLLVGLGLSLCFVVGSLGSSRPNVVVFLIDDLGQGNWLNGATHAPNLENSFKNSVQFDNYETHKWCFPTRSALMTSRYPSKLGVDTSWPVPEIGVSPSGEYEFLPLALQKLGYRTYGMGKWHLGMWESGVHDPRARGFDEYFGFLFGSSEYFNHTLWPVGHDGTPSVVLRDLWNATGPDGDMFERYFGRYSTYMYAEKAKSWIESMEEPFFMYVPTQSTHAPYEAPEEYTNLYPHATGEQQQYNGMVTAVDDQFGNLTHALQTSGLWNNTVLIVSIDNGAPTPSTEGGGATAFPWRGSKFSTWEGASRQRLFVTGGWSGLPTNCTGTALSNLVHVTDLYPTILDMLGESPEIPKGPRSQDGTSMWPTLQSCGALPSTRTTVLNWADATATHGSVRDQRYKLVFGHPGGIDCWSGQVQPTGQWDICSDNSTEHNACLDAPCLFDLETDPREEHDISTLFPNITKTLQQTLNSYKPQICQGNDPTCLDILPNENITEWVDTMQHTRIFAPYKWPLGR